MVFGRKPRRALGLIIAVPLFLVAGALASVALPRDALRATVEVCAAMMARAHLPLPCSGIEWRSGYEVAILDPPVPGKHRLVVPVSPVVGIEDESLQGPAGAAYFAAAWETALARAGGHWDSAGLAVNSARVRTQDQLHFHADCLSALGHAALHGLHAGPEWHRQGRSWVVAVPATAALNPFALIRRVPEFARDPRLVNLGIIGVSAGDRRWVLVANTGHSSYERFLTTDCPA